MTEIILTRLLFLACVFLILSSLILIRNRYELLRLPKNNGPGQTVQPFVSILIPVRNEEENIEQCIHRACSQNYRNYEVYVLDDSSGDRTAAILKDLSGIYPGRLSLISGQKKPPDWLGKSWACSQLSSVAKGEYLFFIDADVFIEPDTLVRSLDAFDRYRLDSLTVWPRQELVSFWEKVLVPLVYHALLTLLPAVYVYRSPRWMPRSLQKPTRKLFAAACGQFIAFTRDAYQRAGGHGSVKGNPVEDVALARLILKKGLTMRMFEGTDTVHCRMYKSEQEIKEGFKKNFFAGFGYSAPLFTAAAAGHLVIYVLPFVILPAALITGYTVGLFLSAIAVSLIFIQWLTLSIWFGWNPLYAVTHPLAVLWFQRLALLILYERCTGKKTYWKGRPV